jgi:hypothetical protein
VPVADHEHRPRPNLCDLRDAADEVILALDRACDGLRATREVLSEVMDNPGVADAVGFIEGLLARAGPETRRAAGVSMADYQAATMRFRGLAIRLMVDVEGETLAGAGKRLGVSRTMATKLYQGGVGQADGPGL